MEFNDFFFFKNGWHGCPPPHLTHSHRHTPTPTHPSPSPMPSHMYVMSWVRNRKWAIDTKWQKRAAGRAQRKGRDSPSSKLSLVLSLKVSDLGAGRLSALDMQWNTGIALNKKEEEKTSTRREGAWSATFFFLFFFFFKKKIYKCIIAKLRDNRRALLLPPLLLVPKHSSTEGGGNLRAFAPFF